MEKLFALPGRLLQSRFIADDYTANLIVRVSDIESFDMLGDNGAEPDLALEQVDDLISLIDPFLLVSSIFYSFLFTYWTY